MCRAQKSERRECKELRSYSLGVKEFGGAEEGPLDLEIRKAPGGHQESSLKIGTEADQGD